MADNVKIIPSITYGHDSLSWQLQISQQEIQAHLLVNPGRDNLKHIGHSLHELGSLTIQHVLRSAHAHMSEHSKQCTNTSRDTHARCQTAMGLE